MSEVVSLRADDAAPTARPGPGGRLQAARLERQIDVAAVATALRVAPGLIVALEADRFDAFGAPVYARGLLRTYARFLNLPVDELLAAYDEVAGPAVPQSLIPPASAGPLPRDWAALKKVVLLLLALLLVGASYWWWMGRVAAPQPAPVTVAPSAAPVSVESQATVDADGPDPTASATEAVTLGGTPERVPSATPAAETAAAPAPTVVAAHPAISPAAAPSLPPPVASGAAHPLTPTSGAAPSVAHATQTALAGQSPPPLVAAVASGPQIVLRGKQECWVEVRAAGGGRLFYGLVRSGETHTLPGPAPWFVFLGYADGVEVSVGGHVIDIPPARREGAKARFGLGADGALR